MNKLYKFSNNRVFFDIGHGCGNACKYCYLDDADKSQIIYKRSEIAESIFQVLNDRRFIEGMDGTIISFCPHTEPFKSNQSAEALLYAIELFAPYKNLIQFATKEIIQEEFVRNVNSIIYSGQVTAFVSISSIQNQVMLEPFASDYKQRFDNVSRLYGSKIKSCIYLKPFLFSKGEYSMLCDLINSVSPDAICLGIVYEKVNNNNFHNTYIHPTESKLLSAGTNDNMKSFIECLYKQSEQRVFLTSTCVMAYLNGITNPACIPYDLCTFCNKECMKEKWGK